jgi:hypothetical protein
VVRPPASDMMQDNFGGCGHDDLKKPLGVGASVENEASASGLSSAHRPSGQRHDHRSALTFPPGTS